jgi:general secretion pathway protein N
MPTLRTGRVLVTLGAGLCLYALFLLVTLPAYWADWLLNRASHNAVRLQQPEGTLWDGSGTLVILSAGQEQLQVRIAWELQPLWLVSGKIQARLRSRDSNPALNATLRIGYRHVALREVEATLPVSLLSAFNPAIDIVAPSGRLQITTPEATLTPSGLEGAIQLTWLDAGARMGGLSEVGDYRLLVNGRGATADLRIETLRGDVGVTAQGEWQTQGEGLLRLTGTVAPGNREQTLRPLLTMVNAQNNNGQYSWTLNTRLPLSKLFGTAP